MGAIIHDIVVFMNSPSRDTNTVSICQRHRLLNTPTLKSGSNTIDTSAPVVYWMDRDMRLKDNWALLYTLDIAEKQKTGVVIVYNLIVGFLGGGERQLHFKITALKELQADAEKTGIPFIVILDETGNQSQEKLENIILDLNTSCVVTDFSPLRIQRELKEKLAVGLSIPLIEVDTHNIVPAWIASQKSEYAAYTLRPKLYRLLPEYLTEIPTLHIARAIKKAIANDVNIQSAIKKYSIDFSTLNTYFKPNTYNNTSHTIDWIEAGEKAAHKQLQSFLSDKLTLYRDKRNDPIMDAQSNLSPYLHYGMLSPQRIVLETLTHTGYRIEDVLDEKKNKAKVNLEGPLSLIDHVGAFLEELIVRRELADNFCLYNQDYDSYTCFPAWAKETLRKHKDDPKEFIYSLTQFERAETHDSLWNAAQMEMVRTGKMHGYMRMYWAKKILEWSKDYIEAQKIAIYLNDTYELDGRDPNGYAGIAWSIGGVHDRAWFPRATFGTVRFMARSGCEKKFDIDAYIAKWLK
jgi:deoxyribodipyrimidine photo-lyase